MSLQESPIYKDALTDERNELAAIIDACIGGEPRETPVVLLTSDRLDRAQADAALLNVVNTLGGKNQATGKVNAAPGSRTAQVAAFVGNRQEDQRVRRDTKVLRMNHKRLMFGCLQTLYFRKMDIDRLLGNTQ